MPGTVAITFSDAAGRDSAVSAGTPLPVTAGGATPAGQTPPASEAPVPIGGLASTTAPTAVTSGQRTNAWFGLNGQLATMFGDMPVTVTPLSATGNLFSVDATGFSGAAIQLTGTWNGTVITEESGDNVTWSPVFGYGINGGYTSSFTSNQIITAPIMQRYFRLRVSSYTSGTIGAISVLRPISNAVHILGGRSLSVIAAGDVAPGATDSGNPVKVGGVGSTTAPTAVTSGQRVNAWFGLNGALVIATGTGSGIAASTSLVNAVNMITSTDGSTRPLAGVNYVFDGANLYANRGDVNGTLVQSGAMAGSRWNYPAVAGGIASSAAEFTIIAAGGAGVRNFLSSINIGHDLLSAGVEFVIRDGAAGAILYRSKLQTPATEGAPYVPPSPLRGTANTAMIGQLLTAVTGGVYVNASGFVGI